MEQKVYRYIRNHALLRSGDEVTVALSGGTTYQGRGWYDEVSGCLKTMPHGVMTDETDGS